MRIKTFILFKLSCLLCVTSYAVSNSIYDGSMPTCVMTPEAATMTRYGTYPVSYYTGTTDVTIPIYTIKNQDIEIPITLDYDASGFRPNQNDGLTGQNWRLMYGGLITRQVRGVPDDKQISIGGRVYDGYLYLVRSIQTNSKEYLLNVTNYYNPDYFPKFMLNNKTCFSHSPDLFTVLLPNRTSFQFMIDNNGQIQIIGGRACKVNITGVPLQGHDSRITSSEIVVTDENGYIYKFGGAISNLEISYPAEYYDATNSYIQMGINNGVINAWYLKTIQTPNNRTVATYSYMNTAITDENILIDAPYIQKSISLYQNISSDGTVKNENLHFTKMVIPTTITTDGYKVSFSYEKTNTFLYGNEGSTITRIINGTSSNYNNRFTSSNYLLKKIEISDYRDTINAQFDYKTVLSTSGGVSDTQSGRQFLKSVKVGIKEFLCEYYDQNLPHPSTKQLDMQMYYNGNSNCTNLLPLNPYLDWNTIFNQDFSHRNTNPACANVGMIYSITYPTGGSSIFEFESHQYGKKIRRKIDGGIGEEILNSNGYLGGVRIKSISKSNGEKIEYIYENDNGASSGIFHDDGAYIVFYETPNSTNSWYQISMNSLNLQYTVGESYIGYSSVIEKHIGIPQQRQQKKKMTFTSRLTNGDTFILNNNSYVITMGDIGNSNIFKAEMNQFLVPSSKYMERGLLTGEYVYNGTNLCKSIEYYYGYNLSLNERYIVGTDVVFSTNNRGAANAYATYLSPYNQMTEVTGTLLNNEWVYESHSYDRKGLSYNTPHNLITSECMSLSNGDCKTIEYLHPLDYGIMNSYSGAQAQGIYELQQKNIVSPIIEQFEYVENGGYRMTSNSGCASLALVRSTIVDYRHDQNCSLPKPKYVYETRLTTPICVYNYAKSYIRNGSFVYNNNMFSTTKTFVLYNPSGRLLQFNDNITGLTTSYIWAYCNQRLLATVVGGEYTSFSNNWGGGQGQMIMYYRGGDRYPTDEHISRTNTLRNSTMQVTTYQHSPLFGVTSITDITGVTTYYEYYPSGELKYEYRYNSNGERNILNAYKYNYQGPDE